MGQLIEFGKRPAKVHPGDWAPTPATRNDIPTVTAPHVSPGDILREVLGREEHVAEVLIVFRDRDGRLGILGNLGGPGESALFLMNVLNHMASDPTNDPPPRRA